MTIFRLLSFIVFICFISSCVKSIDPELRNEAPILVVEGGVSNDTVPYTIRLSYSGPFESGRTIPDQYLEKDAAVKIKDDEGKTVTLTHSGNGLYATTDPTFVGKAGKTYTLDILLKNGKHFISRPEVIPAPVSIAKVNAAYNDRFNYIVPTTLDVSVDVNDPAGQENYYRWSTYSWSMRKSNGVSCGFGCIMYEYCYQKNADTSVRILSDAAVNGNLVSQVPIAKSYIYWYGDHFIDIQQQSLSRSAYQFWKSYQEQITRSGSLLDPLPASIKGNVYNADNPSEFALGYFTAYGTTHKRVVLVPFSITDYLLDRTAKQFITPGPAVCFLTYNDALTYPPPPARQYPPPPGWETAEKIEVRW